MTSMLAKISEAIDASRNDPAVIITETLLDNNTAKLFVSGVMDNLALNKWSEVYNFQNELVNFKFIDDYNDEIPPSQAKPGEVNKTTIIFKNNNTSPYIITIEGWRQFLLSNVNTSKISSVNLAFISEGFETLGYKVSKWTKWFDHSGSNITPPILNKKNTPARSIVKYYSPEFMPPEDLSSWILNSPKPINNVAFDTWLNISCREVLKCLPNELFVAEKKMVGLSGKPPKKIEFGEYLTCREEFKNIQKAARWVYFEGEEVELKHTFLSNELAREWPEGTKFCSGIKVRLSPALESARLLYKAHIRSSSKETLKALGDLRKSLADDMQKIVQQSKELTSSLWRDVALVISTMVIKYTLDASKVPNSSKVYAVVFFAIAIYILLSHFTSLFINSNFIKIVEENRLSWRKKLYAYLDDNDYNELATTPVERAYNAYKLVKNISTTLIVSLSIILIYLGLSEFINVKDTFSLLTKELITLLSGQLKVMANFNCPPFFYHYK
ncbi:TPA: hypothetical protein PXJ49_003244 [Yersinia enterocolitica]|uniref:hypothetical protein n=1 Tax=Yersinia sp. LJYL362 TaxID=3402108 RepID=UPI00330E937A|nr:hypothetical protein [Yersinia enterocolitica]